MSSIHHHSNYCKHCENLNLTEFDSYVSIVNVMENNCDCSFYDNLSENYNESIRQVYDTDENQRTELSKVAKNFKKSLNKESVGYLVEKRNERERYRVRAVNIAFARLQQMVPCIAVRNKRVSKVKTLRKAMEYINELKRLLEV